MSSYMEKVLNYSKIVCEQLTTTERPEVLSNPLSGELLAMKESVDIALKDTSEICRDLEQSSSQLSSRLANPTLPLGETNALLLVTLKQLGDSLLNSTQGSFCTNIEENLSANVKIMQDNLDKAADYLHELRITTFQLETLFKKIPKSVVQPVSTQGEGQCSSDFDQGIMSASSPLDVNKL